MQYHIHNLADGENRSFSSGDREQRNQLHKDDSQSHHGHSLILTVVSLLCGMVYGLAMEKSRVYEPEVLWDQVTGSRYLLLKVYVSACAASMISFSILTMLPATQRYITLMQRSYKIEVVDKGAASSIIGGCILGVGIALCGTTPGLVLTQVGAMADGSAATLLGCLFGTVMYSLLQPLMARLTKPDKVIDKFFQHEMTRAPYFMVVLPWASILGVVVFALEVVYPWSSEVTNGRKDMQGIFKSFCWRPYLAGILIGLLQIPTVLIHSDSFAVTRSFCTIIAQIPVIRKCNYLFNFRKGSANFWQVYFACGVIVGGFLSAASSRSLGSVTGVTPVLGFLCGVLMVFGALLGGGSVSTYGISGAALMSTHSFKSVPAMAAACILTNVACTLV